VSEEFGSEEDVEWMCQQLDEQDLPRRSFCYYPEAGVFKPGFKGVNDLKFSSRLRRVAQISSMTKAIEYLHNTWASKKWTFTRSDLEPENSKSD